MEENLYKSSHKSTQKLFEFNLDKLESPGLSTDSQSPVVKIKKAENSAENPFSFSFNGNEKLNEASIRENKRKLQFGLNLLQSNIQRRIKSSFKIIKNYEPIILGPELKILKKIIVKTKRKALKRATGIWKINTIRLASSSQVASALSMVNKVNTFSRQYIGCSILHSIFSKHFSVFAQKFISSASNHRFPVSSYTNKSLEGLPREFSLLPVEFRIKSLISGFFKLHTTVHLSQTAAQKQFFGILRKKHTDIEQTDRYIILTEQIFQAKEAKEKAEFEKEELAALLESKNEELNSLLDMLEQQKS